LIFLSGNIPLLFGNCERYGTASTSAHDHTLLPIYDKKIIQHMNIANDCSSCSSSLAALDAQCRTPRTSARNWTSLKNGPLDGVGEDYEPFFGTVLNKKQLWLRKEHEHMSQDRPPVKTSA
jgi:hypothetical protein